MTALNAAREKLMAQVLGEMSFAKHYNNRNAPLLEEYRKENWSPPQVLKDACCRKAEKIRIGYIVATCSPTTRAHIELAEQAIRDLGLTHVFFLVWPFHYIHGFHNAPINAWVEREKHIELEHRENILRLSLLEAGIAASVFEQTEELYRASSENFSTGDPASFFWTGTWFVVRVLQDQVVASLGVEPANVSFYFICGEDQFHPNVYSSATKIRRGVAEALEAYCFPKAAAYIRENKFWGYGSAGCNVTATPPAEIFEPLRKFISSSVSFEDIVQSKNDERFVWAGRTREKTNDPYLIVFRDSDQPHFQKYYVV